MADDVVTVRADDLHAFLGLFARIAHLADSPAHRNLKDAISEQDRARVQLEAFASERDRALRELRKRAERAVPGVERDTWFAARAVVLGGGENQERDDEKEAGAS